MKKLNHRLPSVVYLPFFKNSYRNYAILSVVVEECNVYQTKNRAPFYLCFELFRPEEMAQQEKFNNLYEKKAYKISNYINYDFLLSKPVTIDRI